MIFIIKNRHGYPIAILSAKTKESVMAYIQGKDMDFDSVNEFDPDEDRENESMGFVTPLLKTTEMELSYQGGSPKNVIVVRL